MKEYTFLMTTSWRSKHIKANTLREAFKKAKIWLEYQKNFGNTTIKESVSGKEHQTIGEFTGQYQDCKENDCVMSGWKGIKDKKILSQLK